MINPIYKIITIMMIVGIGFTAAGITVGLVGAKEKNEFNENGIPVNARIQRLEEYTRKTTDGETTKDYEVYVSFVTKDNEEIITRLNYYGSTMRVGQSLEILYHKDDPYYIYIDKISNLSIILFFVFGCSGLGLTTGAVIMIIKQILNKKMQKRLRASGRVIRASITGITEITSISVNGVHPQVLEAEFNGTKYRSRYLTNKEIQNMRMDGTVDVYVDRENEKKFFVDLESVKQGG